MSSFDFGHSGCSWCHPGGGPLEYDREGYRYDGNVLGSGLGLIGPNPTPETGDYYTFVPGSGIVSRAAVWQNNGVAEADCLMCHYSNQYTQIERNYASIGAPMGGQTSPKLAASLGLVGGKGQAGLLNITQKAGSGLNPNTAPSGWSWASNTVAADMIVKAPKNEGCAVCHFVDKSWWANCSTTPTAPNCGPAGKPLGATAFQRLIPVNTVADGDYQSSPNNTIEWKIAKGKPEAGKRGESINDANNPDAHMNSTAGMTCSVCHYSLSGTFPAIRDAAGNVIQAEATVQKIDHQFAKGNNLPDGKNMDQFDNTVTCASCHTEGTHPNTGAAPDPASSHDALPAIHFSKLDCRVCHIPVLNGPQQWLVADFTVGPYRTFERNQVTESPTGVNYKPLYMWRKVSPAGSDLKIEPVVTTAVPIWVGGDSTKPTFQRIAKAAAEGRRAALGYDGSGVANWPLNIPQGGDTTLIVNTTEEITDMVSRVAAASGAATPVMNFYVNFFDVSHNVAATSSGKILGSAAGGGCAMCHSSSNPASSNYSPNSVGFFDKTHKLFNNPTEDDPSCGTTAGIVQAAINGIKRIAVKIGAKKPDGSDFTIDLSNVADCEPVGNTLSQREVLGYTADRQGALMNLNDCTACHTQSLSMMNHPTGGNTPASCTTCHAGPLHLGAAINVDTACGQCHNPAIPGAPAFTSGDIAAYAADIHNSKPTANFTAAPDSATAYKVNFSAANSVCPTGHTCTYDWDFTNDGTNDATGIATSNTYGSGASVTVKLTVTTNANTSDSITKTVTPSTVNSAPTCGPNPVTIGVSGTNNMTASFTDGSSDPGDTATLYVNWGDGSPVQAFALGAAAGHTYAYKGTYSVKRYVRDTGGLVGQCDPASVTVGSAAGTSGTLVVNLTGGSFNVSTYIKKGTSTKAFASIAVGTPRPFTLPADTYGVFVYPPTGKKCYTSYTSPAVNVPYINGSTYAVVAGGSTPVDLICW